MNRCTASGRSGSRHGRHQARMAAAPTTPITKPSAPGIHRRRTNDAAVAAIIGGRRVQLDARERPQRKRQIRLDWNRASGGSKTPFDDRARAQAASGGPVSAPSGSAPACRAESTDHHVERRPAVERRFAVNISWSTAPNAKTSVRESTASPRDLLGRHVAGRAKHRPWGRAGFGRRGARVPRRGHGLRQTEIQHFDVPVRVTNTFSGLTSRWTMPRACAAARPSAICAATWTVRDTDTRSSAAPAVANVRRATR